MTLRATGSAPGSTHNGPQHTPRLRLKPKAPSTGHVDGAWWPHSDDLQIELPDLLAVLSVRLGPIDRVTYNFADWAAAPAKFLIGGETVRLSGYYQQQGNTLEVIGNNRSKLVLLVVPTRTEAEHAHEMMMSAATPKNASTVDGLLHN
ncbi:DUF5994 family protein [Mycobacterium sp.]|uniref:DUF5994 family protein n=1 Tax=Mycobacterium sp. TaxID=1785 RepID=UPI003D117B38